MQRRLHKVVLALLAGSLAIAVGSAVKAQAPKSLAGTWTLNVAKSRFSPPTRVLSKDGKPLTITSKGTTATGSRATTCRSSRRTERRRKFSFCREWRRRRHSQHPRISPRIIPRISSLAISSPQRARISVASSCWCDRAAPTGTFAMLAILTSDGRVVTPFTTDVAFGRRNTHPRPVDGRTANWLSWPPSTRARPVNEIAC